MGVKDACYRYSSTVPGLLPWQSYGLAFVIGIVGVKYPIPAVASLALFFIADTCLRDHACRLPVLVFICCAVFGFGYASQRTPELPTDIPAWVEARELVEVRAVVNRVEPRSGDRLRVVLKDVQYSRDGVDGVLPGQVAWSVRHPEYQPVPGQRVRVQLRIVPVRSFGNPGGWDYGWYWQRQGVFWRAWMNGKGRPEWGTPPDDFFWNIKSALRHGVAAHVPDTQGGAMVLALTTGDKSGLDAETMEATRSGGLAHTLALSGLHVGFVAAIGLGLAFLAGWLYPPLLLFVPRPKLAVLLAAPLVLGYAWIGQPSTSLIRAATMFAFWGFLLLQGRGRVLMDGLFFALLAIVFVTPLSVFDLSLQLSMAAVAGIGLIYPHLNIVPLARRGWLRRLLVWAGSLLAISVCANIALMPLVSWYFGTMSPNFLLNLLWLPVLGFVIMPLGLFGMAMSAFSWSSPMAALCLGWAAYAADWLLNVLHLMSADGLTPVFAVLRPLWPEMLGSTLLVVLVAVFWRNHRRVPVELVAMGFVLLVFPHISVMVADSRDDVRLSMLDVGLGQALVVSTPGGHRWLVDGGAGSKNFDFGEAVVAPFLSLGRPPRLDGVIMSHPDVDHSHGLPFILNRFDVGTFYTNGMFPRGRTGKRMREALDLCGMEPVPLRAGDFVRLSGESILHVLHPAAEYSNSRANERSLVLRLERGGKGYALLPGDVEAHGIRAVLASGSDIRADVLILPHHGSPTSFSSALYAAVLPKLALCSNGYLNQYGFPAQEVVEAVGVPVLTTARNGQVAVVWAGQADMMIGLQ